MGHCAMCTFIIQSTHFFFNKCHIYTHVGSNAKFSTNSQETDYSVLSLYPLYVLSLILFFIFLKNSLISI
jgi:hypothetical protein